MVKPSAQSADIIHKMAALSNGSATIKAPTMIKVNRKKAVVNTTKVAMGLATILARILTSLLLIFGF